MIKIIITIEDNGEDGLIFETDAEGERGLNESEDSVADQISTAIYNIIRNQNGVPIKYTK